QPHAYLTLFHGFLQSTPDPVTTALRVPPPTVPTGSAGRGRPSATGRLPLSIRQPPPAVPSCRFLAQRKVENWSAHNARLDGILEGSPALGLRPGRGHGPCSGASPMNASPSTDGFSQPGRAVRGGCHGERKTARPPSANGDFVARSCPGRTISGAT